MFKTIRNMPPGVTCLYFMQGFSTFSFAILYSSLALYCTQQLGLSTTTSNSIVALFLSLNYILQLMGGIIGGRYLSNRALFVITILIECMGLLMLARAQPDLVYISLTLFLSGCGLNTTAYNNMLTQRFAAQDQRRESAFLVNYAAMNIGFCLGYIASGFFDYTNEYRYLFYFSILTNIVTLLLLGKNWHSLNDKNTLLLQENKQKSISLKHIKGIVFIGLLVPTLNLCFHVTRLSNALIMSLSLIMFLVISSTAFQQKHRNNRRQIMAYLMLALSSLLFWMIYLTGPMGITLFIKNNVHKNIGNWELATQWIRNVNPIVIIIGAPLVASMFTKLKSHGHTISVSFQFILAFIFLGLSFFFLSCGIIFSNQAGYTHLSWVIAYLVMQGLAELLIGPAGYAMIGRLAPPELQGIFMGTWMLVSGVAASFSHYVSNAMTRTEYAEPLVTNPDFLYVFKQLGIGALLGGVALCFISRKINKLTMQPDF